jgi:hypothetical protein
MTVQRQERNGSRPGFAVIALAALSASLGLCCANVVADAATTERVVNNRFSGLAIEGFDPVAYFVDGRPLVGRPEFEAWKLGVVWRFRNIGNRASFLSHPEIYGPQFGGYDPVGVARGVTVAGNPRFWVVTGERLYLFSFEANRDAFAANAARFLERAHARWPTLQRELAR